MNETPTAYFERRWASSGDPWDHATRWYETRKYDLTMAVLPRERYRHAVEPACGIGALTMRLAGRADRVTASDRFDRAVAETTARCRAESHVRVDRRDLRAGPPSDDFDLAVLGEVLYYFDVATIDQLIRMWRRALAADGHLVVAHYRPTVRQHVVDGDEVHAIARDCCGPPLVAVDDPDFRLDVFSPARA